MPISSLARHALTLAVVPSIALAQAAPNYVITNVGGERPSTAFGQAAISENACVTGWMLPDAGPFESIGFRWSPASSFELPKPPLGVPWNQFFGADVNSAGTVVGSFGAGGSFMSQGYRWTAGNAEELLSPLGTSALPTAINDAGCIVGFTGAGAVMWSPDLTASFVADLDRATDVNELGQVVGWRENASLVLEGFLWDQGNLVPLGTLDATGQGDVLPTAVDDLGRVVGVSYVGGEQRAFLWTPSAGMTELADLGIVQFPFDVGANDVNDAGWIVGYAPGDAGQTEVIWSPDGSIAELEPLIPDIGPGKSWQKLFGALSINDVGQIAGWAVHDVLGDTRIILLTPARLQATVLTPGVVGVINTLEIAGAKPGELVHLSVDFDDPLDQGYSSIDGCGSVGLATERPRVVAVAFADAAGYAKLSWIPPQALAGFAMRLQAYQASSCSVSNVVRVGL